MLRTAVLRGLRPTSLIFRKQPHSKWNELDFILLEAFQMYEDETAASSGYPVWLTRSENPRVRFEVAAGLDLADAALAKWDEEHQGKKGTTGATRHAYPVDMLTGERLELSGLVREEFHDTPDSMQIEVDDGVLVDLVKPTAGWDPSEYGDGVVGSS